MTVNEWVAELKLLTEIAKLYPQAAYCAFTSGFRQKLNYVIRTIPIIQPSTTTHRKYHSTGVYNISIRRENIE